LLTQELIGQGVVRFFEIRAEGEDSAVDAGLGFAVKKAPVAVPFKDEVLVDAVDRFSGLPAGGVKAEVHQDNEAVEGNEQACVLLGASPLARGRLAGEKPGSPAFGGDARALDRNRFGICVGEVAHELPANRWIGIEKPFEMGGPGCKIVWWHLTVIAKGG
jgi:hypothetical protein